MKRFHVFFVLAAATGVLMGLFPLPCVAQGITVIDEDFEGGLPPDVSTVQFGAGRPGVEDDGCGNNVLMLTQAENNQGAWVWFPDTFDLLEKRVEIEFDLLIGRGTTTPPADGVSVIFQFNEDLTAIGDAGGGLGVGNLRSATGVAYPYVAVSFDIWDNGDVDVETPVDGRYGGASSANVEINQNIDPENVASQATGPSPDYIASADIYGIPSTPGTCDEADLVHVRIVFDNRLMSVTISGPAADTNPAQEFPEAEVISYATAPFPADSLSNIGFAASTGSANAWQWIDNLLVVEDESKVSFEPEPPLTEGAVNVGGPAVDASAEVGASFLADRLLGEEISRTGDIDTGFVITTNRFGRIQGDGLLANARPVDVSKIAGAGAQTETLFQTERRTNADIEYLAEVVPGKYDVTLYFAESNPNTIDVYGRGQRIFSVDVAGEEALCRWSPGAAGGSADGSGDPNAYCTGAVNVGIARTFTVNVEDPGDGVGQLSILVKNLGGNDIPPANPLINALSFERVGNADASAISGDVECFGGPTAAEPSGVLIEDDFEDAEEFLCPPGWVCNKVGTGTFNAQVLYSIAGDSFRLRSVQDGSVDPLVTANDVGTTVISEQTVNVKDYKLRAEFDIYMDWDAIAVPADGGSFFVLAGNNTSAIGLAGGYLAIPAGTGFTVEFDSYSGTGGGPVGSEPSGYNTANTWVHVGINDMTTASIETNFTHDPSQIPVSLGGTGWPNFRDPDGVHVIVTYDAGLITVELEGLTEDGSAFGPQVVVEASVWPIEVSEAVVGFSGTTGGLNQTIEFDNVTVEAEPGEPETSGPEAAAVAAAKDLWEKSGELYINTGGPTLLCSATQNPAPQASGDATKGQQVVWIGDQAAGADPYQGELFTVSPLNNVNGTANVLGVAGSDMGAWDARGTEPGIDDNDRIFHSERYNDQEWEIPAVNGEYTVTLYFANSHSGTAGTARRFFHVDVEGGRLDLFDHCQFVRKIGLGAAVPNPVFGFDELFDPVDAAEQLYSANPCAMPPAPCADNLNTLAVGAAEAIADPDGDQVQARNECGNAAAVAIRLNVTVNDGALTLALTEPDTAAGEPASPDGNPKISGISIKGPPQEGGPGEPVFHRGDANADGDINITDGIYVLNYLFLGGPTPTCLEAANGNDDADINITDGIFILNYLFLGGPSPPAPGPVESACGPDPAGSPSNLGCVDYPAASCQ